MNHVTATESVESDISYVYSICNNNDAQSTTPAFKIQILGDDISVIVDSGASVNILDEVDFGRLRGKPELAPSNARIISYLETKSLPVIGNFEALVKYRSFETRAEFHVFRGSGGSLLSWTTSKRLGLLTLPQNCTQKVIKGHKRQHG